MNSGRGWFAPALTIAHRLDERQAERKPLLFAPTVGPAITASNWFLRGTLQACRTTGEIDLQALDWHLADSPDGMAKTGSMSDYPGRGDESEPN